MDESYALLLTESSDEVVVGRLAQRQTCAYLNLDPTMGWTL